MIAIGVGTHSTTTVGHIHDAVQAAQIAAARPCSTLATLSRATFNTPIEHAAKRLGLTATLLPISALLERAGDCVTVSPASLSAHGVPSIAEASALAAAGAGSKLIVPRFICAGVTAAVAISADAVAKDGSS